MTNVRFAVVLAASLTAIGCATSGGAPATNAARVTAAGSDEVRFMGHRLVVQKDAAGKPTSAKAWGPGEKEIPAHIVPFSEVDVCVAKPGAQPADAAASRQCEPFNFIPDGTSFKTGANSICWYVIQGRLVYYAC